MRGGAKINTEHGGIANGKNATKCQTIGQRKQAQSPEVSVFHYCTM